MAWRGHPPQFLSMRRSPLPERLGTRPSTLGSARSTACANRIWLLSRQSPSPPARQSSRTTPRAAPDRITVLQGPSALPPPPGPEDKRIFTELVAMLEQDDQRLSRSARPYTGATIRRFSGSSRRWANGRRRKTRASTSSAATASRPLPARRGKRDSSAATGVVAPLSHVPILTPHDHF